MTSAKPLRVLVVGGGIGGLTLAHGLHNAGVNVVVYERDRTRDDWLQGYRIHINPHGSRALHDCLPPELWNEFVATAGELGDGFGFVTDQLRDLVVVEPPRARVDPASTHYPVSRVKLREVLLHGLDDVVHFDKQFVRYEDSSDGKLTAFFADGTSASGDVLVGADGVGSRVRQQYLPAAQVTDTGVLAVVGKLVLDEVSRAWLPHKLQSRPNNILPPSGSGMFVAQFIHKTADHPSDPDYLFWAFVAPRTSYSLPADPRRLAGEELRRVALSMTQGWHPDLRRMVAESDPRTIAALSILTSEPMAAWRPSRVTLLGDAIHAMTPLQGIGGNTALRDAALLSRKFIEVNEGRADLCDAIGAYEAEMRQYASEAVRSSLQTARYAVSGNPVLRGVFKTVLRVAGAVPPLKQLMFSSITH